MNLYNNTDKLRAYYVRQLRASGWKGNGGGWVVSPTGRLRHGWSGWITQLSISAGQLVDACQEAK